MLKEQDKIFTNLYGFQSSNLESSKKEAIGHKLKNLLTMEVSG